MSTFILGNGLTAYIAALMLHQSTIYVPDKLYTQDIDLSNLISLKLDDMTNEEKILLRNIIDYDDAIVIKKAGFLYNNKIYSNASDEMIFNYLQKQNRHVKDFKFETEYEAINLTYLVNKYKHTIKIENENKLPKTNSNFIVTNRQCNNNYIHNAEYIIKQHNDMHGYSYIYDCNLHSNIKRYSENMSECISKIDNAIEVQNYYNAPTIFAEHNLKTNNKVYYVGRYASKTRIEQIDVIRFCLRYKENQYEV